MRVMVYLPASGSDFADFDGSSLGVVSYPVETEISDELAAVLRTSAPKVLDISIDVSPAPSGEGPDGEGEHDEA